MTEQTVPFGGTAVAEPPAPVLPDSYDDEGDGGNRRKLAVVGALVGVVVLLVVAFFMMKGGSDPAVGSLPPQHPPVGSAPGGHAAKPVTLPKPFKGAVGRDPFKALYNPPAPQAPTSGVTGGTTVPTVGGTGTDTGTTGGNPFPTTGGTGTGNGPAASFAPVWVELVAVKGTKSATFVVGYSNGKKAKTVQYAHVAAPSDSLRTTFAGVFALLSVQDGTATVQFGDGTPFDLAPGFGNRHFVG
jgi:hypothetical protein